MPRRKASLLVVDDDVRMLRLMTRILEMEGYGVLGASNGQAALDLLDRKTVDLVLLDVMMPDLDGYTVCGHIRETSQVPIIMVTVKDSDEEKVKGFDTGADDYVTKPFSSRELAARVKAVLHRARSWDETTQPVFQFGDLVVDFPRHRVTLHGQEVNLTATEYRLLSYLIQNAGRLVTPAQILEAVWGEEYAGEHHLLRVNIGRLRRKLEDNPKEPQFISTRVGIGYMFLKPR